MQFLRNLTWRLVSVSYLVIFIAVFFAEYTLTGIESRLPQATLIPMYVALAFGFIVSTKILRVPTTLLHEIGHAVVGSILGGKVTIIRVEQDTSGVTYTYGNNNRMITMLRAAGGPLAPPIFFLFTVLLLTHGLGLVWMAFLFVSIFLITITTVRSVWGWISSLIVLVVLGWSLNTSLDLSSEPRTLEGFGIWATSTLNVGILLAAYMAGIGLRYSWRCRRPWDSNQDEVKVGKGLFLPPRAGGWLVFLINVLLLWFALSLALGWSSPWIVGNFL